MKYISPEAFVLSTEVGRLGSYDVDAPAFPPSLRFRIAKRVFDLVVSLILLPVMLVVGLALVVLNPLYNRGSLFFVQDRMGYQGNAFPAYKFRSMTAGSNVSRGAYDPIEVNRITPLGQFLRKSRLDELPQVLNVLRGEMSLIGPRPDFFDHAKEYVQTVPGYKARYAVRPGVSGYAQTEVGYAANLDAVTAKVAADLYYIRNRRLRLEAWIVWRTLQTVLGRKGA